MRPGDIGHTRGVSGTLARAALHLLSTDPTALQRTAGEVQTPLPRGALRALVTCVRVLELHTGGAAWIATNCSPDKGKIAPAHEGDLIGPV